MCVIQFSAEDVEDTYAHHSFREGRAARAVTHARYRPASPHAGTDRYTHAGPAHDRAPVAHTHSDLNQQRPCAAIPIHASVLARRRGDVGTAGGMVVVKSAA